MVLRGTRKNSNQKRSILSIRWLLSIRSFSSLDHLKRGRKNEHSFKNKIILSSTMSIHNPFIYSPSIQFARKDQIFQEEENNDDEIVWWWWWCSMKWGKRTKWTNSLMQFIFMVRLQITTHRQQQQKKNWEELQTTSSRVQITWIIIIKQYIAFVWLRFFDTLF